MVAELQKYFIKQKGDERGPYALSQLSRMWVAGIVTSDALYRTENTEEWFPLAALSETLEALSPVPLATSELPSAIEVISHNVLHERLVEGNGTKEFPFVIEPQHIFDSAKIEREIIDLTLGAGTHATESTRLFNESTRGKPKNSDLCQIYLKTKGKSISVWFDLFLVTKMWSTPEAQQRINEILNGAVCDDETKKAMWQMSVPMIRAGPVFESAQKANSVCWFSGLPSNSKKVLKKKLYLHLKKAEVFSRERIWRETIVEIPRCKEVADVHSRQQLALFLALLGMPIAFIWEGRNGSEYPWWIRGLIGLLCGLVLCKIFYPVDKPTWKTSEDWKKYPAAATLIDKGWTEKKP